MLDCTGFLMHFQMGCLALGCVTLAWSWDRRRWDQHTPMAVSWPLSHRDGPAAMDEVFCQGGDAQLRTFSLSSFTSADPGYFISPN